MAAVQGTDPAPPASLGEHSPPDQLAVRHPRPPPPPPVDRAAVSAERRPPVDPSYGAPLALLISVLLEGAKRRGGGRSEQGSSRGTKIDQVKLRKLGAAFKKNGPVTAGNSSTIRSPRFEQKLDCRNGPVEELLAEALTSEGGCVELVRGKVQHPGKDYHTGTPGTIPRCKQKRECHNGPVDELLAEALTFEGGDEKLARGKVKHPRKSYHTGPPRTSPRFEQKLDCHNGPVEELLAEALTSEGGCVELVRGKVQYPGKDYHTGTPGTIPRCKQKRECHNGPVDELLAEALTFEGGDEKLARGKVKHPRKSYHTGPPRTSPRFEQKLDCHNGPVEELLAEALTSEGGCVELVRGKVQYPGKDYHTGTPGTSPRCKPKRECHNGRVDELPAKTLTSEGGDEKLARGKVKHPKKNYHTDTPRTSPRFEQKLRNGPVEELPAEALIFEGADSELMRGRAKHPRKDYHTGTPRTSPRFEPKRERRNGPVEELAANHKRFRTLEELIASPDTAESAKTPSTDSAN